MAFETGTATSLADLIAKLFTFAVAQGWTQDEQVPASGKAALHKGNVFVSFQWDTSTPLHLGMYQALGFTGGNSPGNHPNDSGQGLIGTTNSTLDDTPGVLNLGDGAFVSYFFFTGSGTEEYIHVVVELNDLTFRHFGFGEIVKFGSWTGGEYMYGHHQVKTQLRDDDNTYLLDGLFADAVSLHEQKAAPFHLEGFPGQAVGEKWGAFFMDNLVAPPVQRDSVAKSRMQGGFRGGPIAVGFAWIRNDNHSGFIPMIPVTTFYVDRDPPTREIYYLGHMADVRSVNIKPFEPKDL